MVRSSLTIAQTQSDKEVLSDIFGSCRQYPTIYKLRKIGWNSLNDQ